MSNKQSAATSPVARRVSQSRPSIMSGLVVRAQSLREQGRNVIDLGAGVPDYPAPEFLLEEAAAALRTGSNSYGDARGVRALREALGEHFARTQQLRYDADAEITITGGASAAIGAALLALVNPGDGVALFDPYFEMFLPQIKLAGGRPKFIPLTAPDWSFSDEALRRALSGRTRVLLLNTPHNPTGRVFSRSELHSIARCCIEQDVIVISDETYEPFVWSQPHISIAALPGMRERTIVVGSVSKTFNVAGWRIGSAMAPAPLTDALRLVSNTTLGAAVPLQLACARAMPRYGQFVSSLWSLHRPLRKQLWLGLIASGFAPVVPQGTLSIWADASPLGFASDFAVCDHLLNELGILAAPGSAFLRDGDSRQYVRFSFARTPDTIAAAVERLCASSARTK